MDEESKTEDQEATLLHGNGISGRLVVAVCIIAGLLIGLGMVWAMASGEVDASYVLPEGTPTATPVNPMIPWGT